MDIIEIIGYQTASGEYVKMPLFTMSVSAGVPTPVDNHVEREIDLNEFLVEHPATTFFARVHGDSLVHHGVRDSDILVVDSSIEPTDGKIVIAGIKDELTLKIYRTAGEDVYLESHNHQFLPLKIEPYLQFKLLGVVTKVIHSF